KPLGVLDGALAGREYVLGSAFTVADLNVASVLTWAPLAQIDLSAAPNAAAWLGRCTAPPAPAPAQQRRSGSLPASWSGSRPARRRCAWARQATIRPSPSA